jgi:hypothetical protein
MHMECAHVGGNYSKREWVKMSNARSKVLVGFPATDCAKNMARSLELLLR